MSSRPAPTTTPVLPADGSILTARGVRSREALLDASRRLFRTKGFANTTIADITDEADKALGTFYTYFDNKAAVLEQLARDFKDDVDRAMRELDLDTSDRYERVRRMCAVYWESCRDHAAELAAIFSASMVDAQFADRWRGIRADARRKIAADIRAVAAAGIATDPDPDATASALGSMIDYFCYVWVVEGGELGHRTITDDVAIDAMARVVYRTMFASSESASAPIESVPTT